MLEIANMVAGPEVSGLPAGDEYHVAEVRPILLPSENRTWGDWNLDLNEFGWINADNSLGTQRQIFALRYSVYCLEKNFLNPDLYHDNCEQDEFDSASIHLAICHKLCSGIAATARIVVSDNPDRHTQMLPLYRHCDVEPQIQCLLMNSDKVGEVSRLAISKSAIHCAVHAKKMCLQHGADDPMAAPTRASAQLSAILLLYKNIYQQSRVNGINYLLAAMEKSLRRLFRRFHFPFRQIGKEVDYYGAVAPYILDLDELDAVLTERLPWLLAEFRDGLDDRSWENEPETSFLTATTAI